MNDSDLQLLENYAQRNSQDSFTALVNRHLNLVFSAALRQVHSPQLAEEISQSVFADLARSANKLKPGTILAAWLYEVTRHTAIDVVRRESRRQLREKVAHELTAMNATADDWKDIEPFLDEAMHALDATDRAAVLLRYFENKSLREVGEMLGTSDDAAQKRVSRAVERLREFFTKRGVTIGASGLVVVISANAVQAAPMGLAVTISTALTGTITTATITTMSWINLKTMGAIIAAAAATCTVTHFVAKQETNRLRDENQNLIAQNQQLTSERDTASSAPTQENVVASSLSQKDKSELIRLRGEVGVLRSQVSDLKKTRGEKMKEALQNHPDLESALAKAKFTSDEIRTINVLKQVCLAMRLYAGKHGGRYPTDFNQFADELKDIKNLQLDAYELVNAGTVSENSQLMIMVRERVPRKTPDGSKWKRIYGLSDGAVLTASSDDGDFDTWEKEHTASPVFSGK